MEIVFFPNGDIETSPIRKFIKKLAPEEKADLFDTIEELAKDGGVGLDIKKWRGKIKEVYFKENNRLIFKQRDKTIYLLHAFHKQKNETEKHDSKIIEKREKKINRLLKLQAKEINKTEKH